jgi:hypothetical protein
MAQSYPNLPIAETRLIVMTKNFLRKIKGTGVADLDGKVFKVVDGELVLATFGKTGSVTLYNTNVDTPCAALLDAKAARSLSYVLVPTDADEFDAFILQHAKPLVDAGMPLAIS